MCMPSAGNGTARKSLEEPPGKSLEVLFDMIIEEIPAPTYEKDHPFQMLVADLSYSDYLGRLAIGKVFNGVASFNEGMVCINEAGT